MTLGAKEGDDRIIEERNKLERIEYYIDNT